MSFDEMQKKSIDTYMANIEYLKRDHVKLYEKIYLYEQGIKYGLIKEKFELNYKDGYFDVINLETKEYFYNKDSEKLALSIVNEQLDFNPKNCSFKTYYEVFFSEDVAKKAKKANMFSDTVISNAPIIHYVNTALSKNELLKSIPKLILFGVGLGTHIPYLHLKAKAKIYLIIEPNLELFRLSLFIVKYFNLSQMTKLIFSIAENEKEFTNSFDIFYNTGFIYNHYIKHFMFSSNCDIYVQLIQKKLVAQSHLTYEYSRLIQGFSRTVNYIKADFKVLNINMRKSSLFDKKPIIILAAGPSLQKNIEFIKENQNKFIIVALYVILPYLEKNNIVPDIVTQYDQGGDVVYNTITQIKDINFFRKTLFLFASHLDERVMSTFVKDNIFVFQAMYDLKQGFGFQTAPSIGEITYALMLRFQAKEIYLLGLDMALDPETNKSHIDEHHDGSIANLGKEKNNKITLRNDLSEIKGNLRPIVKSNISFIMSINSINKLNEMLLENDSKVYNLSDGAYFEKIIPLKISEISLSEFVDLDKMKISEEIREYFNKISEVGFNNFDISIIEKKLIDAKILRNKIDSFFKLKDSSLVIYEDRLGKLIDYICFENYSCDEMKNILLNFILHNIHYVYHLINIKNLDNPKKHLKNINKIIREQMLKIVDTYINILS